MFFYFLNEQRVREREEKKSFCLLDNFRLVFIDFNYYAKKKNNCFLGQFNNLIEFDF